MDLKVKMASKVIGDSLEEKDQRAFEVYRVKRWVILTKLFTATHNRVAE